MNILYVDTEGSYSYKTINDSIKRYLPKIDGVNFKTANHKKTELRHIAPFLPTWCPASTPLNNHSYVIKDHRQWLSVGWDLEGIYEWKRLRKTDSPHFDIVASVDPVAVQLLNEMGKKSFYLPLGFDPGIYKYQEVGEKYQSDVLIAGVMYKNRARWVKALKPISKEVNIRTINCKHWEANIFDCKPWVKNYHNDKVSTEELVKYCSGAKIIIIGHRDFESGNDQQSMGIHSRAIGRIFQETACKTMVLSDDTRPNLKDHFVCGKEVEVFHDEDELREKILYYLKNESEREQIALKGYIRTMRENTYLERMKTLCNYMKGHLKNA